MEKRRSLGFFFIRTKMITILAGKITRYRTPKNPNSLSQALQALLKHFEEGFERITYTPEDILTQSTIDNRLETINVNKN
jgi:hypothetical protein